MKKLFIILLLSFITAGAKADICNFGDFDYDPIDCAAANRSITGLPQNLPNATAIPVDGGASLLLAGGIAFGTRKLKALRDARKLKAAK